MLKKYLMIWTLFLFFTFHKCASSFFSKYILENINGLYHIDYNNYLAKKNINYNIGMIFPKKGFVIGPIRLSSGGRNKTLIINPASIKARTFPSIVFIRDPRDILVSFYFSAKYSHPIPPIEKLGKILLDRRKALEEITLDEFVLKEVENYNNYFKIAFNIYKSSSGNSTIIKYEDMINNFDLFKKQMLKHFDINNNVFDNIYKETRPKEDVDDYSHRRSGSTRRFEKDLQPETINILNKKLEKRLIEFDYQI